MGIFKGVTPTFTHQPKSKKELNQKVFPTIILSFSKSFCGFVWRCEGECVDLGSG
jgi:hypothetical protein